MRGHGLLMAAAGGSVVANIVFDSAAKVSGYSIRAGSPTISYDATNIGMLISGSSVSNFVAYDAFGNFARPIAFEMNVKFVSDSAARKHFGFFCDSGSSGVNAYRLVTLDSNAVLSKLVGATETFLTEIVDNIITVTVGSTYKIKVKLLSNGSIEYWINDALIASATDSSYAAVRPGFFVYGDSILVKDLSVVPV